MKTIVTKINRDDENCNLQITTKNNHFKCAHTIMIVNQFEELLFKSPRRRLVGVRSGLWPDLVLVKSSLDFEMCFGMSLC